MPQIVFILTGKNLKISSRYLAGLRLAALSVRHFHPNIPIVCLGDEACCKIFDEKESLLGGAVDHFIPCLDAEGGVVHRSRVIKTSLRQRVNGPFVYLDTDTILVRDIHPLLNCRASLGLVADSWFPESVGQFPSWCTPVYRDLNWRHPTDRYYNSGVIFSDNSPQIYELFNKWQHRYAESVTLGISLDQPAFNCAIQHMAPQLEEYSEDYNFFCGRTVRPIPPSTRLLHVCCSLPATRVPIYEEAVRTLQYGGDIDIADLVLRLQRSGAQIPRKWQALREIQRRSYELVQRKLCKMKWTSAADS